MTDQLGIAGSATHAPSGLKIIHAPGPYPDRGPQHDLASLAYVEALMREPSVQLNVWAVLEALRAALERVQTLERERNGNDQAQD